MDALKGEVEEEGLVSVPLPPGGVLDDVHRLLAEQVGAVLPLALVADLLPIPEVVAEKVLCTVARYPGIEKWIIHDLIYCCGLFI